MAAPGDRIGDWLLLGQLGEGGNATVWEASREGAPAVALKLLRTRNIDREPYRRFVREVETLRSLSAVEGVLPLLEAHLPPRPTRQDPSWLTMPIAVPMSDSLAGQPLEEIVGAVAAVAATMARLKEEHKLAHRDLKPGNLYRLENEWLVGDFGLVAVPDVEELTKSGRPLGPAHFTAYEMIVNPADADPYLADVFSLAKTLWVLAVEQRFPPAGHQPMDASGYTIADLRPHRQAGALDRLVDAATRLRPEVRPNMDRMADDLAAWLTLSSEPTALDVSDVRSRLRKKMAAELQGLDVRQRHLDLAYSTLRRLTEMVGPLNDALREIHPQANIDLMGDRLSQNLVLSHEHSGSPTFLLRWQRCSMIGGGQSFRRYVLRMARGVELEEGGDIVVRFMIDVGLDGVMQTDYNWQSNAWRAPVESIAMERMLQEGVTELSAHLDEGLRVFEEKMPSP